MSGAAPEVIFRFGSYELHPNRRQLLDNGLPVSIGQRAFDVLTTLVERAGELVTKDELLQHGWPDPVVEENNLQLQVSALRKVLGTRAIVTTAARGYRFTLELGGQKAKVAAAPAGAAELIAVPPLENLSGSQEEYFADGMTEARIDPDFHPAPRYQREVLVELHRYEEGISALTRSYELGGKPSRHLGYLGYAYARAGQKEQARQCLDELDALAQHAQYVSPYFPALVLSGLEEHEAALDRLEQADAVGDQMLRDYLKGDPQWDRMRALPRFQDLMQKMAYPEPPSQGAGLR